MVQSGPKYNLHTTALKILLATFWGTSCVYHEMKKDENSPRQKAQLRNCELTWVIGGCNDFDDKDDDDNMMIKMMYTLQGNADRREKARSYLLDFRCLDVSRADRY